MPCECELEVHNAEQARVLKILLTINAAMFVIEGATGLFAQSTGLVADSLDMLADAAVYGIGLHAVGRPLHDKARAAFASGIFQCLLGASVLVDVARRAVSGSEPLSPLMVGMGALALGANLSCLALLSKHRDGEVHMRASWIFSTNDVLANLGVIGAGLLVALMGSALPDLIIGSSIAALVVRGGLLILSEARKELKLTPSQGTDSCGCGSEGCGSGGGGSCGCGSEGCGSGSGGSCGCGSEGCGSEGCGSGSGGSCGCGSEGCGSGGR